MGYPGRVGNVPMGRVFCCLHPPSAIWRGCQVTAVRKSARSAPAPVGMNTVELLRVASSSLGLSPHRCMRIAEQLCTDLDTPVHPEPASLTPSWCCFLGMCKRALLATHYRPSTLEHTV